MNPVFEQLIPTLDADGRWEGPTGQIVVEVKKTNSVRDVRGAFLALAYLIMGEPSGTSAVCVIVETRLSSARLQNELARFRQVIHPDIAGRIHFLVEQRQAQNSATAFGGSLDDAPDAFYDWLTDLVASERLNGHVPPLPARQTVIAALARLRLRNDPPVTVKYLQQACQVSYPTVAAVLKELAGIGWLEDSPARGVRLRPLTTGEWMDLARDHARQRGVYLFTDPTGHGSPEQMAKRLAQLQRVHKLPQSVRIGGVMGAARHFPALDITAPPRLDLSVNGDAAQVAALLDAGLSPKTRPEQRVALAMHVTRDPWVITDRRPQPQEPWASELECLSDLVEMGFMTEASEMAQHMALAVKPSGPAA